MHHAVTTSNPEAQRYFDQGLTLIYAFNHDEAARSFRYAAVIDPKCAMAYWGVALAVGPNYNDIDIDLSREKAAVEAMQKASALAGKVSDNERGYIHALSKRYSADPKADRKQLALDYKQAMGELMRRYPDDFDAAVMYAESAMDLHPWQLWTSDGKPAEGTLEIVEVLQGCPEARAGSHRRESLLRPRDGSIAESRAGRAKRRAIEDSGAGRRTFGPHACPHLHPAGRLSCALR